MADAEVLSLLTAQLQFEEGSGQTAPPKLVRVLGRAATGKTILLLEIARQVRAHYQHYASALVVAPTKNAANALQGETLNSGLFLRWGPDVDYSDLQEQRLSSLRNRLEGLEFILVDNAQQCSNQALFFADMRLRQVFSANRPFAGKYVYLFEDESCWTGLPTQQERAMPHSIWNNFTTIYHLGWVAERCTQLEDVISLCETLGRLRERQVTQQDVDSMRARHLDNLPPATREDFKKAITVVMSEDLSINSTNLQGIAESTFRFGDVDLKIGARVVLTAPLNLVPAGATGVVEDRDNGGVLHVRFDSIPDTVQVHSNTPLILGWAVNLSKAMGLRFDRVVVELPDVRDWERTSTYLYSALSRAKGWSGLALKGDLETLPNAD